MKKILHTLDARALSVMTMIFLILVPLYPKFPFLRIDDTYISVRLEDFYVALMALIFGIQLLRKKIFFNRYYTKYILIFWTAIIASFLLNYFVTQKIQYRNIGAFHTLRRIEYMLPFCISYAGFMMEQAHDRTLSAIRILDRYFAVAFMALILVCLYALGQKSAPLFQPLRDIFEQVYRTHTGIVSSGAYFFFRFFDFPAVQTMNAEFAKGALLNLTPESRVSSTFAGHYDLAAYLVFFIPIISSYIVRGIHQIRHWLAYILAIFTLVLTSSRASFAAFIVSMLAFCIYTRKWKLLALTIILTGGLMYANSDMTERFKAMFQKTDVFVNTRTGEEIIDQGPDPRALPKGSQFVTIGGKAKPLALDPQAVIEYRKEMVQKEIDNAKKSGKPITHAQADALVTKKYKQFQDVVVQSVIAGDTSLATRTQVEWPRAMRAFMSNPVLGTGPSSITESTDGDYFRWLGETGLLGTGIFLLIIGSICWRSFLMYKADQREHDRVIYLGFCAGIAALLVNATLIDVFEASKVAFVFWTICGLMIASMDAQTKNV